MSRRGRSAEKQGTEATRWQVGPRKAQALLRSEAARQRGSAHWPRYSWAYHVSSQAYAPVGQWASSQPAPFCDASLLDWREHPSRRGMEARSEGQWAAGLNQ